MYIHHLSGLHLRFFCSSAFRCLPNKLQPPEHIRKVPYSPLFIPIQLAQAVHHCHDTVPIATPTVVVWHGDGSEVAGTAVSLQGVTPGPVLQGGTCVTSVCGADRRPLRGFSTLMRALQGLPLRLYHGLCDWQLISLITCGEEVASGGWWPVLQFTHFLAKSETEPRLLHWCGSFGLMVCQFYRWFHICTSSTWHPYSCMHSQGRSVWKGHFFMLLE